MSSRFIFISVLFALSWNFGELRAEIQATPRLVAARLAKTRIAPTILLEPINSRSFPQAIDFLHKTFEYDSHSQFYLSISRDLQQIAVDNRTRNSRSKNAYWIARDRDEDLRVVGVTGIAEDSTSSQVGWLFWLAVDPNYRGRGFGSQLLSFTLERAKEMGFSQMNISTSTIPQEAAAQDLYKKFGFVELKRTANRAMKCHDLLLARLL